MKYFYQKFNSPLGDIYIATDSQYLRIVAINDRNWIRLKKNLEMINQSHEIIKETEKQLEEYFHLNRKKFQLPIHFSGTEFQIKTWKALLEIPYGKTKSYAEQAISINHPKAVRAIGRTNGLNPISIIVPCHRVIGKSGKLTGYASGLADKQFLLNLEK